MDNQQKIKKFQNLMESFSINHRSKGSLTAKQNILEN